MENMGQKMAELMVNKHSGNRSFWRHVGHFSHYSQFSINKYTSSLTSLPSTLVGVDLGCSSCCECVLVVWDRPGATRWAGLPQETSNSVHTFLGARSLQAVWLWSTCTHKYIYLAEIPWHQHNNLFTWGSLS